MATPPLLSGDSSHSGGGATADATPSALAAGSVLRCPSCRNPIRLGDRQSDEVHCPACGSTFHVRDSAFTDTVGPMTRLGRFELLERVGQGAGGAVWKARDTDLDRVVAIKIPHSSLLDSEDGVARFSREARAAAQLRHPGIVTVHEVATFDGRPTIVAEFVTGLTLRDLVKVRPLTFRESAGLVAQIADALDYAHGLGLVHRDVKPSNIMIEPPPAGESGPGRPLLMDFGIALRDEAEVTMTMDGQVVGTPAYMSPEQAAGHGHRADRRCDVYGLGVVLYELLTGEVPFRGNRQMILHQVMREEPRPPRRQNNCIPRDLETICLKAMEKEPAKRYATAADFAADLRRFLAGEPVVARPVGHVGRAWRWCGRNRGVAGLAAALLLALVSGATVSAVLAVKAHWAAVAAEVNEGIASQNAADALVSGQKAKDEALSALRRAYNARMLLAAQAWEANEVGRMLELLDSQTPEKTGGTDLRGFEWHYLTGLANQDVWTLRVHTQPVTALAISPDGRWIASAGENTVQLWSAFGGHQVRQFSATSVRQVAFTPDGDRLVAVTRGARNSGVRVWDLARGEEVSRLDAGPHVRAVSADGCWAVVGELVTNPLERHNHVDVREVATGRTLLTFRPADIAGENPSGPVGAELSPDSRRVAVYAGTRVTMRDIATGATVWQIEVSRLDPSDRAVPRFPPRIDGIAFSPDGRRVAVNGLWVMTVRDAETGAEAEDWPWPPPRKLVSGGYSHATFSPDGRLLAAEGPNGTLIWQLGAGKDREPIILPKKDWSRGKVFSPTGGALAVADRDGKVTLWDTGTGIELGELQGHTAGVRSMAYFPDGDRLATVSGDGTVKVWSTSAAMSRSPYPLSPPLYGRAQRPDDRVANQAIGFDATGQILVASSRGQARAWHVDSRQPVQFPDRGGGARHLALHPTQPCVAVARFAPRAADDVILWDTARDTKMATLTASRVSALAFSPDGQFLAGIEYELTPGLRPELRQRAATRVRIWEFPSGREAGRLSLPNPSKDVLDAAEPPSTGERLVLGPGARWLAILTMSDLQVWDVVKGTLRWSRNGQADKCFFSGLSLSPDGQWLAIGGWTGVVRVRPLIDTAQTGQALEVWDAEVGRPVWCANGPGEPLAGVAFGPGQRLFTAGQMGTIRVWDMTTHEVVLALPARTWSWQRDIAVSRDGRLLAAGMLNGSARVWDARTVTEQTRRDREAAAVLEPAVRSHLLKVDAVAALRSNAALPEEIRTRALEWLALRPEDAERLNRAAWAIVRSSGETPDRYERAFRLAEIANREAPCDGNMLNTLGVAEYRLGRYAEAAATLARSAELNNEDDPNDYAFLAMAQHRLGKSEEARLSLARLRELVKDMRNYTPDAAAEKKQFLAEAEALIAPPAAKEGARP